MTCPQVLVDDDIIGRAADRFVTLAQEALVERGSCAIALAGGSTPKALYERLTQSPHTDRIEWAKLQIFFGDERSVAPDHPDSNYRMVRQMLLERVPIKSENVHRMRGESDDLKAAAAEYEQLLRTKLPANNAGVPMFELVLLGMGNDGHTASLFPGTRALSERDRLVVTNDVPQLNTARLTLTYPAINAAAAVWMLATGPAKAARVAEVISSWQQHKFPIQRVNPDAGSLLFLLDPPAARELSANPRLKGK